MKLRRAFPLIKSRFDRAAYFLVYWRGAHTHTHRMRFCFARRFVLSIDRSPRMSSYGPLDSGSVLCPAGARDYRLPSDMCVPISIRYVPNGKRVRAKRIDSKNTWEFNRANGIFRCSCFFFFLFRINRTRDRSKKSRPSIMNWLHSTTIGTRQILNRIFHSTPIR